MKIRIGSLGCSSDFMANALAMTSRYCGKNGDFKGGRISGVTVDFARWRYGRVRFGCCSYTVTKLICAFPYYTAISFNDVPVNEILSNLYMVKPFFSIASYCNLVLFIA